MPRCPSYFHMGYRILALNALQFSPAAGSMQLFMWQPDIVGDMHFIMDCCYLLVSDAHDDVCSDSDASSLALAAE